MEGRKTILYSTCSTSATVNSCLFTADNIRGNTDSVDKPHQLPGLFHPQRVWYSLCSLPQQEGLKDAHPPGKASLSKWAQPLAHSLPTSRKCFFAPFSIPGLWIGVLHLLWQKHHRLWVSTTETYSLTVVGSERLKVAAEWAPSACSEGEPVPCLS